MAIKLELDTLDGVSPELSALYEKGVDGRYRLDLELADGDALSRALKAERELRKSAQHSARETERKLADIASGSAAVAAAQAEAAAAKAAAEALRGKWLETTVTQAAQQAGLVPSAVADAVRAARDQFVVADDGAITPRDAAGRFTSLADWFAASRETSPHWHPASANGMSSPTNRVPSAGSGTTVSRSQFDALSPAQRAALSQAGVTVTD